MKKISLLFVFVLLLASCSENNLITPDPNSDEGVHATLGLSVAPMQGDSVKTRSVTNVDENLINRVWVLQFDNVANGSGVLLRKKFIPVTDVTKIDIVLAPNAAGKTSNIYFVANAGRNVLSNFYGTEANFKTAVGQITSELGLVTSNGDYDQSAKCIPMCGSLLNKTVNSLGVVGGINVTLTRMLARIDFTCTVSAFVATKFALKNIRLCNVPNAVKYFDENVTPANPSPAPPAAGSTMDFNIEGCVANDGKTYTFYVPENLRGIGTNVDGLDKYKSGVYGATYIELSGKGLSPTLLGEKLLFKVYPGSDSNNNYDLKRNTKYVVSADLANLSFSDRRFSKGGQNCYIVKPGATVDIAISRANDSALGVQIPDVYNADCVASVFWETGTTEGGIATVSNPYCDGASFQVIAGSLGNAVVILQRKSASSPNTNPILWSWHIWVSDVDFKTSNTINTVNGTINYTWMDRNLGATAIANVANTLTTSGGLFYQWGRKDPFLNNIESGAPIPITPNSITKITASYPANTNLVGGSETYLKSATLGSVAFPYVNQLLYSIQSPMLYMTNWAGSTATITADATVAGGLDSWSGEYGQSKSVYDPCPAGWRVPSAKKTSADYSSAWNGLSVNSYNPFLYSPIFGYYSPAGYRNVNGNQGSQTNYGYYWAATASAASAYSMTYYIGNSLNINYAGVRSNGYNVRCVQE